MHEYNTIPNTTGVSSRAITRNATSVEKEPAAGSLESVMQFLYHTLLEEHTKHNVPSRLIDLSSVVSSEAIVCFSFCTLSGEMHLISAN